jgi:LysM repeat protein
MALKNSDAQENPASEEEELYQANVFSGWKKRRDDNLIADLMVNPLVWAGVFVIIAAILLLALWPASDDEKTAGRIENLTQKIEMLENRIFLLESNFENAAIGPKAENQPLQNLETRIVRMETAANQRMLEVNGTLEGIEKKISALQSKIEAARKSSAPSRPKAAVSKTKKTSGNRGSTKYYTVVKGDTLYGISRKHGMTVDQLLNINNISKSSPIKPGQKLKLSP